MDGISNGQRALWMVLITSLAAPFFASLTEIALTLASPLFDFALPPRGDRSLGEVGMAAFAWAAIPATIGALGLLPYVLQTGTYGWLHAAVGGVLAYTAAVLIVPVHAPPGLPLLPVVAGFIAIGMRAMLIHGRILKA
jgi:hypothetical protein